MDVEKLKEKALELKNATCNTPMPSFLLNVESANKFGEDVLQLLENIESTTVCKNHDTDHLGLVFGDYKIEWCYVCGSFRYLRLAYNLNNEFNLVPLCEWIKPSRNNQAMPIMKRL